MDAVLVAHGDAVSTLPGFSGQLSAFAEPVLLDEGLWDRGRRGSELLSEFDRKLESIKEVGWPNTLFVRSVGEGAATFS